ncbi:MAG: serine/threonine-protein kinase [Candidatus Hydrogenedentes bacterium]|nr:serine/threonine-protein kinase [Candidatus Hydrogenedentota bacterium]
MLDALLAGKWVDAGNVGLVYALGVAWESAGQRGKACEAYQRVRMFNATYKDVDARLAKCGVEPNPSLDDSWSTDSEKRAESDPVAMQAVQDIVGPRYRFDRELGRGGMGVIYLAHDLQLDRLVAVKFLGSLVDHSTEYRERFLREAKAAAKVSHPNIVAIFDVNANLGKAHIVMEHVTGPDLRTYIKEKVGLSPREAVHFASQIANALDAIHKVGLVHRDVKPDNILLDKGGAVKLTDFGLAKVEQARITQPNVRMGTPAYMAPEQARTSDVDGRADIYSLGLVLHEMLTGKPVFPDITEDRDAIAIPPPSAAVPNIPAALDAAVLTCLAKRPEDRYQSAAELLAALRKISI